VSKLEHQTGPSAVRGRGSLDSWHTAEDGVRVDHTLGTFVSGTQRRFVFRWDEGGGKRELVLDEERDGGFVGTLGWADAVGGGERVRAVVVADGLDPWRIEVDRGTLTIRVRHRS